MPLEKYELPNDDYEVIIIRRKQSESRPPNPFFSIVLAVFVSYFTIWLLTDRNPLSAPNESGRPAIQIQS